MADPISRPNGLKRLALCGCTALLALAAAGPSIADTAKIPAPNDTATATMTTVDGLRGMEYCEIFLIGGDPATGGLLSNVYNTSKLNGWTADNKVSCPTDIWAKVTVDDLKSQYDVLGAFKNGPRIWVNDVINIPLGGKYTIDGLDATWYMTVSLPKDFMSKGQPPYAPADAHRASTMVFKAGQPLFILDDPQGIPWVMQAMSQIKDPTLTYDGLKDLASKLQLPAGWSFRVKVIDQDLTIGAVNGLAKITQDELQNTYDGCFPGMCSFVP